MSQGLQAEARGLILAPRGRDGLIAQSLLREAGTPAEVVGSVPQLAEALGDGVTFVLLTEEAVRGGDLRQVAGWIGDQPSWSDLPFIVLTQRGGGSEHNPGAKRLADALGNVSFLERPFHATTLVSMVHTAAKARARQFDAKGRIDELRESEARLKTALQAGRLGSWELDVAKGELLTSPSCRAVFGRAPGDGFTYGELQDSVHPLDRERMRAAVGATLETGDDYAIEYRNVWPDGSVHWAEIRARFIAAEGERAARLVGVSSDITERKGAEGELRALTQSLEQRVVDRTAELQAAHAAALAEMAQREKAEEALRQAQKMEAVGQLTGGVAHDFNNLLTIIRSSIDYLKRPDLPSARHARYVQAISDTTDRAAKLTGQLLAFARRQPLKPEVFDLLDRVQGVVELVRPLVGSRIAMELTAPAAAPPIFVEADISQFETALVNLAVNARDAMEGEGRLSFTVGLVDAVPPIRGHVAVQGVFAAVSVADTGSGVPAGKLDAIFEPFYTTKDVGKGTGLGLSQVFGFAKQSGGDVEVESDEGAGARFTLYLRVAPGDAPSAAAEERVAPDAARRLCVLVVEDNEAVGQFATEMLSDLGHDAVWAGDAGRAIAAFGEPDRCFDVVFSDVIMPGMNGLDLAREIRRRSPDQAVVLTSGYSHVLAQEGADGFQLLRKPYSLEQLSRALASAVR